MDLVGVWDAAGNPGSSFGTGLLLVLAAVLLLMLPVVVALCIRGSGWKDQDIPAVRWMTNKKVRAFASAAAAGDFHLAEHLAGEIMGGSISH
jgi:hypothetical protein